MANTPNAALYDHVVVNLTPPKESARLPIYKNTAPNAPFSTKLLYLDLFPISVPGLRHNIGAD
jgi:hypothetical protein